MKINVTVVIFHIIELWVFMKFVSIVAWFSWLFGSLAGPLTAQESEIKIPIEASQLMFADHEIFAYVAGAWVPVSAVYSENSQLLATIWTRWICPRCGYTPSS